MSTENIMKRIGLALVFLLSSCALVGNVDVPGGRRAAAVNTWKITSSGGGSGTAFPVLSTRLGAGAYETTFITARHVVAGASPVGWTINQDGRRYERAGYVLAKHPSVDVALVVFVTKRKIDTLYIRTSPPALGEEIWTIGYPAGRHRVISYGIMSSRNHGSSPIYFGNSGGPVVDSRGAAIGIAVAILRNGPFGQFLPHVMFIVPLSQIKGWLKVRGIHSL